MISDVENCKNWRIVFSHFIVNFQSPTQSNPTFIVKTQLTTQLSNKIEKIENDKN